MGLSTHVLDTMHGCPAAGMAVGLYRSSGGAGEMSLVRRFTLNQEGRSDAPLYRDGELMRGSYRLLFDVGSYFKARGVVLPEPNFLSQVTLDFGVAQPEQHYHVPLLVSPWSYATYRGS